MNPDGLSFQFKVMFAIDSNLSTVSCQLVTSKAKLKRAARGLPPKLSRSIDVSIGPSSMALIGTILYVVMQ